MGSALIYQTGFLIGAVLEDAGPPRPSSQNVDEFAILNASQGLAPKMGGDAVFVTGGDGHEHETRDHPGPPWQKLDVVREGRVYGVSDDLWMLGIGPTAAVGVVDDPERHLAEG